jgi:PAS domain S-box-containing protein
MQGGNVGPVELLNELGEVRRRVEEFESENTTLRKQRTENDPRPSCICPCAPENKEDYPVAVQTASEAICITQDIDRQAQQNEETYRRMVETANEGIWAMDGEFRTTFVNRHMASMLGYTEEEMRGRQVDSFMFAEDLGDHQTKMARRRQGEGERYERRFRRKDGEALWTIVSATALRDSEGKFAGSFAMFTDITERQMVLQALQESEEKYRLLFSKETDAIALVDGKSHVFLDVNEAFIRLYGYSKEEILGLTATVVSAEPEKTMACLQIGVAPHGSTIPLRWHKKRDGTVFPVEISINPITFKGRPGAYAIIRDITQRKRTENLILAQQQLSIALSAISGLDTAFEVCIDTAMRVSGMDAGAVFVVSEDSAFDLAAQKGLGAELPDQVKHLAKDMPETKMLLSGSSFYASRSFPEIAPFMSEVLHNAGFRCSAAIPIVHQSQVLCSLHLFSRKLEDVPDEVRIALEAISAQIGGAVSRIRAEDLVIESKNTIEALQNATTDGLLLFDRQKRLVLCNQAAASCFGMEIEDVKGKTLFDVISRDAARSRETKLDEVFRAGKPIRFQDEREGRCFDNVVTPLPSHDAEVTAVAVYYRDITELKRSEEALRHKTSLLNSLIEALPDIVYFKDRERRHVIVNRAYEEFFRMSRHEVIGKTVEELMPADKAALSRETDQEVMKVKACLFQEQYWCNSQGDTRAFETRKFPILDDLGQVMAVGGISRDITERKRVEEELRQSEERYRILTENSLTGICVQQEGKLAYVNDRGARSFGYAAEELIGQPVGDLVAPYDREMVQAFAAGRLRGEDVPPHYECRILTSQGEPRWVEILATCIMHKGSPAILANIMDITDRKRAQEEIVKAKNAAESANRAKSEFLANMSHELRTPLNAIIGFSEILEDELFGPLNEAQQTHVRYIVEGGHDLLQLVSEILDLAKIESGRMRLEPSCVKIVDLLENSMAVMRQRALRQDLELELKVDPIIESMTILADELKLRQVMLNLLSNAVKFTPERGKILVGAGKVEEELVISVVDTGLGIDAADTSRIFKAFEQVDSASPLRQQGTGLGLALSSNLIHMHGGRIWVESEGQGKGSAFKFAIPLKNCE